MGPNTENNMIRQDSTLSKRMEQAAYRVKLEVQRNELNQQQHKLIEQLQSKSHVKPEDSAKLRKKRDEIRNKLSQIEIDLKKLISDMDEIDFPEYFVVKRAYPSAAVNQHIRSKFCVIDPYTIITNHERKKRRLNGASEEKKDDLVFNSVDVEYFQDPLKDIELSSYHILNLINASHTATRDIEFHRKHPYLPSNPSYLQRSKVTYAPSPELLDSEAKIVDNIDVKERLTNHREYTDEKKISCENPYQQISSTDNFQYGKKRKNIFDSQFLDEKIYLNPNVYSYEPHTRDSQITTKLSCLPPMTYFKPPPLPSLPTISTVPYDQREDIEMQKNFLLLKNRRANVLKKLKARNLSDIAQKPNLLRRQENQNRKVVHWDFLLHEMQAIALDFHQERLWQVATANILSKESSVRNKGKLFYDATLTNKAEEKNLNLSDQIQYYRQ